MQHFASHSVNEWDAIDGSFFVVAFATASFGAWEFFVRTVISHLPCLPTAVVCGILASVQMKVPMKKKCAFPCVPCLAAVLSYDSGQLVLHVHEVNVV